MASLSFRPPPPSIIIITVIDSVIAIMNIFITIIIIIVVNTHFKLSLILPPAETLCSVIKTPDKSFREREKKKGDYVEWGGGKM